MSNNQEKPILVEYAAKQPLPDIPSDSLLRTSCYLCGLQDVKLEIEHVIPKLLFRGYDPGKYVRLWACSICNRAKGFDDEYIVRFMQASSFVGPAKGGFQNALRGFQRPNSGRGLATDMADRLTKVPFTTAGGIYLGNAPALQLDGVRFEQFVIRIAKGLWVRTSLSLFDWSQYNITCQIEQAIQSEELFRDPIVSNIRKMSRFGEYWKNICSYFTDFTDQSSISILIFYSSYSVVITIVNKKSIGEDQ